MFVLRVRVYSAMLVAGGQVPGGLQMLPTGVTFFVLCVVCVVCV
jgi:hypothetical protein